MKTALPITISLFALVLSAYTIWATRISGPSLACAIGSRIGFTIDLRGGLDHKLALVCDIIMFNRGASPAFVEEICLVITQPESSGRRFVFSGWAEAGERASLSVSSQVSTSLLAISTIVVPSQTSVCKTLHFICHEDARVAQFTAGTLEILLCARIKPFTTAWLDLTRSSAPLEVVVIETLKLTKITDTGDSFCAESVKTIWVETSNSAAARIGLRDRK